MKRFKASYFQAKDIPVKVSWMNDIRINEHMYFSLPATEEATMKWFTENKDNVNRVDFTFKENEKYIAMGGFTGINHQSGIAEFYVMVNPEMQGKGIGRKVSLWMYNYAFVKLQLNKIFLYTDNSNIPSSKIYEKAGFQQEGLLRQHKLKNGILRDRRVYGLLREEWEEKEWRLKQVYYDF
ncbi:GNAT family N-acetyltransferase [Aequorivita sinensis]|uniref:GNAT family N-acetyltransferase n=1 Tax=Aequorivita sinensis TaxID=1382458 RepID=UPI002300B999|nr:GNAT family protein [Aequorivita sinensis]